MDAQTDREMEAGVSALGQAAPRQDARWKVAGAALYPGDLHLPGTLHMKMLFAGRPHARVRAVDTRWAEAHPGVLAVFTARDVPVNEYGLIRADQPVLCGPGSAMPGADVVRYIGDRVALIVAETEQAAADARDLIQVAYEDLEVVTDPRLAMRAPNGAPLLFEGRTSNVLLHQPIRRGDVAAGFAAADVVVEAEYQTSFQEHAYLQPEAGVAYVDGKGRVTLHVAGQWAHDERRQVAHALGLPEDTVRVVHTAIGGAFGGREDMSVQIALALAVWRLSQRGILRPVKIIWSREESILGHHKRHPMVIKAKWGARHDGTLTAAQVEIIADAGAYQSTSAEVTGIAAMMCTGPYNLPNVAVDAYAVYTNNVTCGAFRGFGAAQAALVAEGQMNKLAERLGIDPVEMRLRNLLSDGVPASVGTPLAPGVTIREVVEHCARGAGWTHNGGAWQRPRASALVPEQDAGWARLNGLAAPPGSIRRGVGFACGFKNVGFNCGYQDNSWARIELYGDGQVERAIVRQAGADVGQGAHTVMRQMAAEALGLPLERVELIETDTDSGDSGAASASRLTFMAGNAIRGAARAALDKWADEDRPAVGEFQYLAPMTTPFDPVTGYSSPNITYGYAAEAAEVDVDVDTGHVRVLRVVCADDAGRVINPQSVTGQIEGAVVQGQGYALLENLVVEGGYVRTPYLSTYLIPTVLDVPERVDSVLLENPDPYGPFGARGVAEVPLIPMAAAIAAAVQDATGVWINRLPLTPERVWAALHPEPAHVG
jgi:CO/xanthine dehydrogenase Mo-binding subunit